MITHAIGCDLGPNCTCGASYRASDFVAGAMAAARAICPQCRAGSKLIAGKWHGEDPGPSAGKKTANACRAFPIHSMIRERDPGLVA